MASSEGLNQQSAAGVVRIAGAAVWQRRMSELLAAASGGQRSGRAFLQHHAIEIALERLARGAPATLPAQLEIARLAQTVVATYARLSVPGRAAMRLAVRAGLAGDASLVPLFHLFRTAALQQARGFTVRFAGFEDGAAFDLLVTRQGMAAEIVCDVLSAEEGRDVHRGAWDGLLDRVDPDLQTWLANHPGRYLLKLTLPQGLRAGSEGLASLHGRISTMLREQRRADHDEAAILRLDPLLLAAAQARELGLIPSLRAEFGHEAHLAVTTAGNGMVVLAARAGRINDVAAAMRRRMSAIAPSRLSGANPGILAMFIEDTDRAEWRHLREQLELEGAARHFLTHPEARCVIAVTCASRHELLGAPEAAEGGELRFRNPAHPAAGAAALAPAVVSLV